MGSYVETNGADAMKDLNGAGDEVEGVLSAQNDDKATPGKPSAQPVSTRVLQLRNVFVLDDDGAEVAAIKAILEGDGYFATTFTNPAECIDALRRHECDVLLCDLVMPEIDGLQVLRQAREVSPDLPVIVVTGHGNIAIAVTAMKRGASDFVEKPFDRAVLLDSINTVLGHLQREWAVTPVELSRMERVVLRHIIEGNGNKHIAHMLGRSVRTIEDHRSHLMRKFGATNVVDLVRRCIAMGLA